MSSWPSDLIDLLQARASAMSSAVAFGMCVDGRAVATITYEQMMVQVAQVGRALRNIVPGGGRVLVCVAPGLDFPVALFGCFFAGLVAVPAAPPTRGENRRRFEAIQHDCRPDLVLTSDVLQPSIEAALGGAAVPRLITLQALLTSPRLEGIRPAATELALIQYTSGSTGTPKGVCISHSNLVHNAQAIEQCFGMRRETVGVTWLPPYHIMHIVANAISPVWTGYPMYLLSPMEFIGKPFAWLQTVANVRASATVAPNLAFDLCADHVTAGQKATLDLSSLEVCACGSEPIRAETLDRFARAFESCRLDPKSLFPCYGLTESTLLVAGKGRDRPILRVEVSRDELDRGRAVVAAGAEKSLSLVSCGLPAGDAKLEIVDPVSRVALPDETVGEIWIHGRSVTRGYWGRDDANEPEFRAASPSFPGETFLRTGDLGLKHRGELFVTGRIKEIISIFGRKLHPSDLEETARGASPVLAGCPCAALANPDEDPPGVRLILEAPPLDEAGAATVIGAVRRAVESDFGVPISQVSVVARQQIPLTMTGKVQRLESGARLSRGELLVQFQWAADAIPAGLDARRYQVAARMEGVYLEQVAIEHPEVADACMVRESEGALPFMIYVATADIDAQTLAAFLRDRVKQGRIPEALIRVTEIYRRDNGYVLVPASRHEDGPKAEGSAPALEATLAAQFASVLGLASIPTDQNFFLAGGHSLKAVQLLRQIQGSVSVPVSIADIAENPTPQSLARLLWSRARLPAQGGSSAAPVVENAAEKSRHPMNRLPVAPAGNARASAKRYYSFPTPLSFLQLWKTGTPRLSSGRGRTTRFLLPFDLRPMPSTFLYQAYPLGMLGGMSRLALNGHIQLHFRSPAATAEANNMAFECFPRLVLETYVTAGELDCTSLLPELQSEPSVSELTEVLIRSIDLNRYVYAYVDLFFIPGSISSARAHLRHEVLIIGYDLGASSFVIADYKSNGRFDTTLVPIVRFHRAFVSAHNRDRGYDYCRQPRLDGFTAKTPAVQLNAADVADQFQAYLRGTSMSETRLRDPALAKCWDDSRLGFSDGVWGVDCYAAIVDYLATRSGTRRPEIDHRVTRLLWEHKAMMGRRIVALYKQRLLSDTAVIGAWDVVIQLTRSIHLSVYAAASERRPNWRIDELTRTLARVRDVERTVLDSVLTQVQRRLKLPTVNKNSAMISAK